MIRAFVAIVMTVLVFAACDNDFDLITDKKEIPVVYALLNKADTAQYFRIERAFVDENRSPIEIAQNPDSLYYSDAVVSLTRTSTGDSWTLQAVDGIEEGYPRQAGAFATSPNTLYKIRTEDIELIEKDEYRLTVDLGDGVEPVEATTTLLRTPNLPTPKDGSQGGTLEINPSRVFSISWNGYDTSFGYDAYVLFYYSETKDGTTSNKSLEWRFLTNSTDNEVRVSGREFYNILAASLEADPSITRQIQNASFTLVAGAEEITDYIRVGRANLGITSSGEIPTYEGSLSYGLGLFSSRYTHLRDELTLTPLTLDSIRLSDITKDLNFQ